MVPHHSLLHSTISSVSVLQITAGRAESLAEGDMFFAWFKNCKLCWSTFKWKIYFLMQSGNPTLVRIASCIHYIYMFTLAIVIGFARGIFENQILKKKIRFLEKNLG